MNAIFTTNALASAENPTFISVTDSLLIALIGITLVFAVLAILMLFIKLTGQLLKKDGNFSRKHPIAAVKLQKLKGKLSFGKKEAAAGIANVEPVARVDSAKATGTAVAEYAAGTCGDLTLIKTEPRDAALIMAIVADASETPLNQLRFKSIKKID
jgi:Na+-transporting methylmalonyl-CoA/oxaloacetate decarboxylase gamma subunit